MFRLKHQKLLSRGLHLLFCLAIVVMTLEEYVFKPDKTIVMWTVLTGLVIAGAVFFVLPLEFREQQPVNRWYRAAYRAAWPFSALLGALIILSVVFLGIMGPTPGQFPVSGVLIITGLILIPMGIFVIGGLLVTGYIAQGNEETRQWARSLGRRNEGVGNTPSQEDTPPA